MTLWLDVDDIFEHAARHGRPSGIQRVSLELAAALRAGYPGEVEFFRAGPRAGALATVAWEDLAALRQRLSSGVHARASWRVRAGTGAAAALLPPALRRPLGLALRAARPRWRQGDARQDDLRARLRPGDAVAAFGAPWARAGHAEHLAEACSGAGARLALLVHDCIPLAHPGFCDPQIIAAFSRFIRDVVPRAAHVLTTTRATAAELEEWLGRQAITLRARPTPIPPGTAFPADPAGDLPQGLTPGSFVLMVGTLEPRKNHALAFAVWRRLLAEMPRSAVPRLVFAGRRGWMIEDLLRDLSRTAWLDGHVIHVEAPDDGALAALYRGCRFTLFPSHAEGWGLPVSESLACGKPCIASGRGAIVEAGGEYCLYIDPDDIGGAHAVIRGAIEDPSRIAALAARIARTYRPRGWDRAAEAVIAAIGPCGAAPA